MSNSNSGSRAANALSRIGQVYSVPSDNLSNESGGAASGGGSYWDRLFQSIAGDTSSSGGATAGSAASGAPHMANESAKKLPRRQGNTNAKWKTETPIPERPTMSEEGGDCPDGLQDLGVIMFIHDVEPHFWDFARHSDADRWMAVHTVTDLIQGLRDLVGTCGFVRGVMIDAHGGYSGEGGFRMGDDTNGNGHLDGNEGIGPNDPVSGTADATAFGNIIKGAFDPTRSDNFISISSCGTAGTSNKFLKALEAAMNVTSIGSVDKATTSYSRWSGSWWSVNQGRVQVNTDGSIKTDNTKKGTGVWRPF